MDTRELFVTDHDYHANRKAAANLAFSSAFLQASLPVVVMLLKLCTPKDPTVSAKADEFGGIRKGNAPATRMNLLNFPRVGNLKGFILDKPHCQIPGAVL